MYMHLFLIYFYTPVLRVSWISPVRRPQIAALVVSKYKCKESAKSSLSVATFLSLLAGKRRSTILTPAVIAFLGPYRYPNSLR
jgi:hypothetical protein